MADGAGPPSDPGTRVEKEARLMVRMREAHSKALQVAASKLRPEVFERHVRPVQGEVDVDASALAAKVVARVVERSEDGFRQLCERMAVNEKLLALERQRQQPEAESEGANGAMTVDDEDDLLNDGQLSPLPGGRQPADLVREGTMRLKLAERARLLALAEKAEKMADVEAKKVSEIEFNLAKKLGEVAATQQALTEAASSLP